MHDGAQRSARGPDTLGAAAAETGNPCRASQPLAQEGQPLEQEAPNAGPPASATTASSTTTPGAQRPEQDPEMARTTPSAASPATTSACATSATTSACATSATLASPPAYTAAAAPPGPTRSGVRTG